MIKFEPIEGNGWYVSGRRIPPPSAFFVEDTDVGSDGTVEGIVNDGVSEFDGYRVRARPTFNEDKVWLSVHLSRAEFTTTDGSEPEVVGYVRMAA